MARGKHLIVGNWKMYVDSVAKAKELSAKVARTARRLRRTETVLCPPHPFIGALSTNLSRGNVRLGAQDVSTKLEPKHTGEVSVYALRSFGVSHVIVGHSERRALGESNATVARKIAVALKGGLSAILCVGEEVRDLRGEFLSFLETQIKESLKGVKLKASQLVVAYEPIWAIGKSADDAVTPAILNETALFIKKILVSLYGRSTGTSIRILYGGSVEAPNAGELIKHGGVDGFLIGHASIDADEFTTILKSVDAKSR